MRISPLPTPQRARGRVEVAFGHRRGAIRLDRLFQSGCAKALLPRTQGDRPEVVLVNTSGGVAGGDRLGWHLAAGDGAALVATTQAAERIYRSTGADAHIETRLDLGAGARLDWLPRETILFEGGRLDRRLTATLAADASLTALETIVLGRAAMGETVSTGFLGDHWRIYRAGQLIHAEALRLDGDIARATIGPATLAGARAIATLVHVAPDAELRLDAARALLADLGPVTAAASAWNGKLVIRFVAPDNAPLRTGLIRFLTEFRRVPLPRIWTM